MVAGRKIATALEHCNANRNVRNLIHTAGSFLRWSWFLNLYRNPPHFMKTEGSLPYSQQPATYPDP